MSEEGKKAALAIADQMRLKDERIAELEHALRQISSDYAYTVEGGGVYWGDRAKAYAETAREVLDGH